MKSNTKLFSFLIFIISINISNAQSIFNGTGTGTIPDNNPSGLNITFAVSGITKPIKSVSLELTMSHTFIGDLTAYLNAPNGIAGIGIFGRTGYRKSNNLSVDTDLNGTYLFNDEAIQDWWNVSDNNSIMPSGTYRSSTLTISNDNNQAFSDHGGCTTRINGAFIDLMPSQTNGNWNLNLNDLAFGDEGMVTSARLIIEQKINNPDLIFISNFENEVQMYAELPTLLASDLNGTCKKSRFDFTGTGLASFSVATDDGEGGIDWTIQDNDQTISGAIETFKFGTSATDLLMEGDIDGDGIKDAIVWRRGVESEAAYYVRRSSRPNDLILKFSMGQTNDDAGQLGDYDGDGIEDFAVFRAPVGTSGPTKLIIHQSSTHSFREVNTIEGTNFTVFPTGGYDYNEDGFADVSVQSTSTMNPSFGFHSIYNGLSGDLIDSFEFGLNTDVLIPGNYFGNNQTDINLGRNLSGNRNWYTFDFSSGAGTNIIAFGFSSDFLLSGDYDGDGVDDYAVYRASEGRFYIKPSTEPTSLIQVDLGGQNFYPLANSRVR